MPISLRVRDQDVANALTFDGPRVVLGRGAGSDVRLPDASVSHRHATVRVDRSDFTLVDEGSTNGTYVGGVRLSAGAPRILRTGDLIRLGRVWIEVSIDSGPPTRDVAGATRELALAMARQAMERDGEDAIPKVHVVEGTDAGAALPIVVDGQMYVVGRGEGCDLPLADHDASREHVAVLRRGSLVFLRDLGSKNGAFLGGEPLAREREVMWKPQLALALGQTVLALEEPVASALALLEAAADAPLADDEVPPVPPPSRSAAALATEAAPESKAASDAAAAPIAAIPSASAAAAAPTTPAKPKRQRRRSGWSLVDVVVVIAAIVVLLLSVAGMLWLLK